MAIFSVDNLEAGMTLKSAVCDRSGRLLLPVGTELTDKHLKIFRTWGVAEVDITGEHDNDEGKGSTFISTENPLKIADAQQYVERLFIHNDPQHPMILELMRICIARKVSSAT